MVDLVLILVLIFFVVFPLLLLLLQERKRLHDIPLLEEGQEGSKRMRLGDPGDCYDADSEESDLD